MTDRTQLTEALEWFDATPGPNENSIAHVQRLAEAARLLLAFPTDQQVEAAAQAIGPCVHDKCESDRTNEVGRVLVAVRDTMIGDNQTRCEIDGSLAVAGACPTHGGDNCLRQTMIADA